MYKALKVRLYPTIKQQKMLDNHFDAYRFCYNLCLDYKSTMWKYYQINKSAFDLEKDFRAIRNDTPWLQSIKSGCAVSAIKVLEKSFINFFKGAGYPKFKSKKDAQLFKTHEGIRIKNNSIKFLGKDYIKFKTSDTYCTSLNNTKILNVTFTKDTIGSYYASCLIDFTPTKQTHSDNIVGIDLGIKDLIVTSNGVTYQNNNYFQNSQYGLAKLKRRFSRTKKGSNNRNKLRIKITKLSQKITNQRTHYYHQISNKIIRDNQVIIIESLNIPGMVKNRSLSKSINDASWGLIASQLEYKSEWYGRQLIKIGMFYPSTKTCSDCGSIKNMTLSDRNYDCESCGLSIDRDLNAAINIKKQGMKTAGLSMDGVGYEPYEVESN